MRKKSSVSGIFAEFLSRDLKYFSLLFLLLLGRGYCSIVGYVDCSDGGFSI